MRKQGPGWAAAPPISFLHPSANGAFKKRRKFKSSCNPEEPTEPAASVTFKLVIK